MSRQETIAHVRETYKAHAVGQGHHNVAGIAESLANGKAQQRQIERALFRTPTKDLMYDGAIETVDALLTRGDNIIIWTQGDPRRQLWKVATSGISDLRRTLPVNDRHRLSVHAAADKFASLPSLLADIEAQGFERVIVVDDRIANAANVAAITAAERNAGNLSQLQVDSVWLSHEYSEEKELPEAGQPFARKCLSINSIRELLQIRGESDLKTALLLDFDETLLQTRNLREAIFTNIASIIDQE